MYTDVEVDGYPTVFDGATNASYDLPRKLYFDPFSPPQYGSNSVAVRYTTNHVYYAGVGVVDDATLIRKVIPLNNPPATFASEVQVVINQTTGRVYQSDSGVVTVIDDSPRCSYSLSSNAVSISGNGATGSFTVTASPSDCPVSAATASSCLSATVSGNIVNYKAALNFPPETRIDTVSVGAQIFPVFTVSQPSFGCSYTLRSNGVTLGAGASIGSFTVTINSIY